MTATTGQDVFCQYHTSQKHSRLPVFIVELFISGVLMLIVFKMTASKSIFSSQICSKINHWRFRFQEHDWQVSDTFLTFPV